MCTVDHEAAAVTASPTAAHPHLAHPALEGCEDVAWPAVPGCPVDVPVVLRIPHRQPSQDLVSSRPAME